MLFRSDKSFYGALKSLKTKGLIADERIGWTTGDLYEFLDVGGPVAFDLSSADLHILNRVIEDVDTTAAAWGRGVGPMARVSGVE